jgi:thioredoxin reductase (NADPH)
VIGAVDDEPAVPAAVSRDLRRGYRIMRATSGDEGLDLLAEIRKHGEQIALLIADQRMPGMAGTEYLVQPRTMAPEAKRVLLNAYADTAAAIAAINEVLPRRGEAHRTVFRVRLSLLQSAQDNGDQPATEQASDR